MAGEPRQFDLTEPRARASDPDTSHIAAEAAGTLARRHKALILAWLRGNPGGGNKDRIAAGTGIDHIAVARRMRELSRDGLVQDSGYRARTGSGRPATVWIATPRPLDDLPRHIVQHESAS